MPESQKQLTGAGVLEIVDHNRFDSEVNSAGHISQVMDMVQL